MIEGKRAIITVSGGPGSGKSSTADLVAHALNYTRYSSGDFMRGLALERGVSLDELQKHAEDDPSIDNDIDAAIRKSAEHNDIVIDSRIAFHWIPKSFKVLLTLDPHTSAKRTFAHMQEGGRSNQAGTTEEEVYLHLIMRIESEKKRYKALYNLDYPTLSDFDLVIDTATHPLEEVVQLILDKYKEWSAK